MAKSLGAFAIMMLAPACGPQADAEDEEDDIPGKLEYEQSRSRLYRLDRRTLLGIVPFNGRLRASRFVGSEILLVNHEGQLFRADAMEGLQALLAHLQTHDRWEWPRGAVRRDQLR